MLACYSMHLGRFKFSVPTDSLIALWNFQCANNDPLHRAAPLHTPHSLNWRREKQNYPCFADVRLKRKWEALHLKKWGGIVRKGIGNLLPFTEVSARSMAKPETWKQNQSREHQPHQAPTTHPQPRSAPGRGFTARSLSGETQPRGQWTNRSETQLI